MSRIRRAQAALKRRLAALKRARAAYRKARKALSRLKHLRALRRKPLGEGVDYAWGYHPGFETELVRAGKRFAVRYLSTPGNSKNLTQHEASALRSHGLGVGLVFETTADRALAGYAAGVTDAQSARKQLFGTGLPSSTPIYFAVDFDATPAQQDAINKYLQGAAAVLGRDRVGVYGGYYVVKRALDAKVCKYAWQTYAWSGGQWDRRAHLRQYRNGVRIGNVSCDLTRAVKRDCGVSTAPPDNPS